MRHIALDFDDTLIPTRRALIDFFNARFGTARTWEELTEYRFRQPWPISDELFAQLFNENLDFFHDLTPLPGAIQTLTDWAPHATFHIITGRPECWLPPAAEWLKRNGIPVAALHSCPELHRKGELAATLGITLAIEDNAPAARSFADRGIHSYLLDAPYNVCPPCDRLRRVKSWHEIRQLVTFESPVSGQCACSRTC